MMRFQLPLFSISFFSKQKRKIAFCLLLVFILDISFPTTTWALTGGPSQPEVESFSPIGTSDMVNMFTGDFTYNIPLLDMDGYPINITYNSGISMDQEASWVGLGWNINPGVINRSMRGIPDDFNGDEIVKEFDMKPNRTYGLTAGMGGELFGTDKLLSSNLSYTIGIRYNNYTGMGIEKSLNISTTIGKNTSGNLTGGLGITSSSDEGLSIQPSVSASVKKAKDGKKYESSLGVSFGAPFNSRAGLKQLSISTTLNMSYIKKAEKVATKTLLGESSEYTKYSGLSSSVFGTSSSFNLGTATYTPSVSMPMHNFSLSGRFTAGTELVGFHGNAFINGYYSSQKLASTTQTNRAYGYLNTEVGQFDKNAILDFNRERDGSFTPNTPALPLTNYTYDLYSVSGQGVGGSYRPYRSDIGYVFDSENKSSSDGASMGVEIGALQLFHGGVDVAINWSSTESGNWTESTNKLPGRQSVTGKADYEKVYFKEANERSVDSDPNFFNAYGGYEPQRFELKQISKFNTVLGNNLINRHGGVTTLPAANYRNKRDKRNQLIQHLTRKEINDGFGLNNVFTGAYNAPDHHIAEITSYGTDGMRYVYGLPAYNTKQVEATFAVGAKMSGSGALTPDHTTGLVYYGTGNPKNVAKNHGLDNYYSKTTTPAYAHSYLLTAVLSPDYVDIDNIKGPSDGDLGYYTKFHYTKSPNYLWRTPLGQGQATYNEGLKSDLQDDKANYIYGEKELWYLDSIVSKNYIAVFHTSNRDDALGVSNENGQVSTSCRMRKLDKISLYVLREYRANPSTALPIKEVHFEYDYTLCQGIPNHVSSGGKLTLKKIYFTYQNSNKARLSPYEFVYKSGSANPSYNIKNYDRWGNYKPGSGSLSVTSTITPSEFPYVDQEKANADLYASAWHLEEILLPSGGKIKVEYESDDYAYVQHKRAMQMFKIVGAGNSIGSGIVDMNGQSAVNLSNTSDKNKYIYFKLHPEYTGDISEYFKGVKELYFRCLMRFDPYNINRSDYVSGYARIESYGITNVSGNDVGYIKLSPVRLKDNGSSDYNPIVKAAIQFGRLNLSRQIWDQPGLSDDEGALVQVLNTIINSNFVQNIADAISGPNLAIYNRGKGVDLITNKSWIRLNNPNKHKYGGGVRVKRILMSDEWAAMTDSQMEGFEYGQEYNYNLPDGTSSGVASYEPQLGGDENPWKEPVAFSDDKKLAPDDDFYQETPFGESFFPSPGVGYSMVTVKNIAHNNVTRHATGKVVHEFYTAKDFPTIVKYTDMVHKQEKTDPFSITSLVYVNSKDYMTATQGFVVETNDMHGKPKSQSVYQEGINEPITKVEYFYKSEKYNVDFAATTSTETYSNTYRLKNDVSVIDNKGNISEATIGVFFDMVADMRQQVSRSIGVTGEGNIDGFLIPFPPFGIAIPIILGKYSQEKTQFRSATTTKVIQRFGIIDETVATDLGSVVSTKELAYDAETGAPLITKTKTNFNDDIYTLTIPAHWYYDEGMGQAYKNIGLTLGGITFGTGGVATITNAKNYFVPGDEISLSNGSKGWVVSVSQNTITVLKKDGTEMTGSNLTLKIIRSGRKNLQSTPISSYTLLKNPLQGIKTNIFEQVLQASAVEYSDQWRSYCDCFDPRGNPITYSTNPYVVGIKGNWRIKRSWLHLSPRTQSNYNSNTNIRKDGVFTSFMPFYRFNSNVWQINEKNWTFTSEVTDISPFGQELENRDALGRYSAATFGYRQVLATSVAANARYSQIGFDNFEDYGFSPCADNHFKFPSHSNIVNTESHSGRKSIKVESGTPVIMSKALELCDPEGCTLNISISSNETYTTVSTSGGVGSIQIDWDVINGDPVLGYSGGNLQLSGSNWKIEVTVMDATGCKATKIITR